MKITKSQLEQMIESQLEAAFSEAQSKFSFQEEMEKLKEVRGCLSIDSEEKVLDEEVY